MKHKILTKACVNCKISSVVVYKQNQCIFEIQPVKSGKEPKDAGKACLAHLEENGKRCHGSQVLLHQARKDVQGCITFIDIAAAKMHDQVSHNFLQAHSTP